MLKSPRSEHRNGSFSDAGFIQRSVIEFLTAEKLPPIEIHRRIQNVYGDACVDVSTELDSE